MLNTWRSTAAHIRFPTQSAQKVERTRPNPPRTGDSQSWVGRLNIFNTLMAQEPGMEPHSITEQLEAETLEHARVEAWVETQLRRLGFPVSDIEQDRKSVV